MIDKAVDSAVLDGYFLDIADAIRDKGGSGTYSPAQMAQAIEDIQTEPNLQTKSVTPTESAQVITADSGYDGLEEVDVGAISSSYVGSGITRRSSSDLTASGATVNVPAGYYQSQASKAVASGSAGTPTATKGSVSNHAVTITPSVTNTTGYITGGTKTGTAVSVSASELVSGTLSVTQNGTADVTNYASVDVSVSGGGGSNIVQGTFTTGATRNTTGTVTLNYSGSGYPIACFVYINGGSYNNSTGGNTDWYNSVNRYDCGWYAMTKSRTTTAPTYNTGIDNAGTVAVTYKSSTSVSTSYTTASGMAINIYTSSSTEPRNKENMVHFKDNGTTLAYYIGNRTGMTIGFPPSTEMAYIVIYSS